MVRARTLRLVPHEQTKGHATIYPSQTAKHKVLRMAAVRQRQAPKVKFLVMALPTSTNPRFIYSGTAVCFSTCCMGRQSLRVTTAVMVPSTRPTSYCGVSHSAKPARLCPRMATATARSRRATKTSGGPRRPNGAGAGTNAAVPEPATAVLLILAATGWYLGQRRAK